MVADLITGCAVLDREGLTSAFGHLSARLETGEVLISSNPGPGLVRTEDDLIALHPQGGVSHGDPALVPGEAAIHLRIYAHRADVASVCRFHGPACLAWSTLGRALPAAIGMGLFLGHEVPWFDTDATVRTDAHGDRLAECLDGAPAVLLHGFGAVTVGRSVREAVVRAWLLERSAAAVLAASAAGRPLAYGPAAAAPFLSGEGPARAQLERAWNYLQRAEVATT
jgi:ribulose-5-phosphate 4-epimerase/fuculose-1-phosphate aldolase